MRAAAIFLWRLMPLLAMLAVCGWLLWQWLKRSTEPLDLVVRWIITAVTMGGLMVYAGRATDEISRGVSIVLSMASAIVMIVVWRRHVCDFVGDFFAGLYTGGSQEVDPAPFYSIAQAKRKNGKYLEAIAEIRTQLEQFPTDFTGWMLLAEIQAEDLKELGAAQETIETVLAQDGHAPKNMAFALNRQADWYLKLTQNREAARASLERIIELLPDTEQAQLAWQRIAHLTPKELLAEKKEASRVALPHHEERVGLRTEPLDIKPAAEDPAVTAANLVKHLEEFPYDSDAREKLALIYARHYQRLDLATDQLEQLILFPNQPSKQVVHWLNLLADLQVELAGDLAAARQTLQRIVDLYPKTAAAGNASNRIAYLKLELRPQQQGQAIKLGSYEQNIGLKGESGWKKSPK